MEAQRNPKSKVEPHEYSSNNVVGRFVDPKNEEEQEKVAMALQLPPPLPPTSTDTRKATLNLDKAIEYELKHGRKLDPKMDRKKLRRLSAQRSRVKKAQYIHDMERRVTELEDTITVLTLRVERFKEKRRLLQLQNEALERLVQIRLNEAHRAQMVLEKNKAELERLKEVEKGLLKELQIRAAGWQQQSSYQDQQLLHKQAPQIAMADQFLNFEA